MVKLKNYFLLRHFIFLFTLKTPEELVKKKQECQDYFWLILIFTREIFALL